MLNKVIVLCLGAMFTTTFAEAAITIDDLGSDSRQCVAYARARVPSLPKINLTYWSAKKSIKNNSTCKKGSVAIIEVTKGEYKLNGHLAVVENCDSSGSSQGITIKETHWITGRMTQRTSKTSKISKSQSELNIYGYFRP